MQGRARRRRRARLPHAWSACGADAVVAEGARGRRPHRRADHDGPRPCGARRRVHPRYRRRRHRRRARPWPPPSPSAPRACRWAPGFLTVDECTISRRVQGARAWLPRTPTPSSRAAPAGIPSAASRTPSPRTVSDARRRSSLPIRRRARGACTSGSLRRAVEGDADNGTMMAGQSAGARARAREPRAEAIGRYRAPKPRRSAASRLSKRPHATPLGRVSRKDAMMGLSVARGARPCSCCSGQGSQKPSAWAPTSWGCPRCERRLPALPTRSASTWLDLVAHGSPEETSPTRATRSLRSRRCRWPSPARSRRAAWSRRPCSGSRSGRSARSPFRACSTWKIRSRSRPGALRLMAEAAAAHPGAMSALLKAARGERRRANSAKSAPMGEVLVPANCNCPGQIVVAGTPAADRARTRRRGPRLAGDALRCSATVGRVSTARSWPTAAAGLDGVSRGRSSSPRRASRSSATSTPSRYRRRRRARAPCVRHLSGAPCASSEASRRFWRVREPTDFVETGFGGVLVEPCEAHRQEPRSVDRAGQGVVRGSHASTTAHVRRAEPSAN